MVMEEVGYQVRSSSRTQRRLKLLAPRTLDRPLDPRNTRASAGHARPTCDGLPVCYGGSDDRSALGCVPIYGLKLLQYILSTSDLMYLSTAGLMYPRQKGANHEEAGLGLIEQDASGQQRRQSQ